MAKKRTRGAVRQKNVYTPKQALEINLYQDISDHATELLWGQGYVAKYEANGLADKRLQELMKYNRTEELFPYMEKLLSLHGNMYTTIDMVDGKPTLTLADPLLNSQLISQIPTTDGTIYGMGRAFVTDIVAVIWKKITYGTISFPVKEIWDTEKVTRVFFGENNKSVKMSHVNKQLPKEMQVEEVWYHDMGFVPVKWFKNVPTFGGPSYADGYKGAAPQSLINKTLCELWHETETNRTRIIGNMDESSYNQLMKDGNLAEVNKNDFLINVTMKNSTGVADNVLVPILADPKFEAYWLSINSAKDEFYKLAGYSPLGDGNTEKTATENLLMKTGDYQITKKKRNQRIMEITSLITMMLEVDNIHGFGEIYGDIENEITFQIMENKVMDSLQEITNIQLMVQNDFMSKVEAISQFRGVSMEDAQEIFDSILEEKALEQEMKKELGIEDEEGEESKDKEGK